MKLPVVPVLPVRTARLVLRQFDADDLEPLLAFHSDPEAVRYVPYPPRDRDAVTSVLERKTTSTAFRQEGDLIELAVALAENATLVGDVLLVLRSVEHETLEVGYIFSPAHGGQGYATEAARALLAGLGVRLEAHLVENEWCKGELTSEAGYAVLSREWGTQSEGNAGCVGAH